MLGLSAIAATLALAAPAQATALRTFVSSTGNDANTASSCIATAPCRTLAAAFSVTQDKGHIFMTDVAGYGALTITRSVTLVAIDGALIGVPTGGTGITINAGVNDDVTIDGLILDGAGVGANGIVFNTGRSLTITKTVIRGMTSSGISFQPSTSSRLAVSDTLVANISSSGCIGITPSGTADADASVNRVEVHNCNGHGISAFANGTGTVSVAVVDCVAAHTTATGFIAVALGAGTVRMLVARSTSLNNFQGIFAQGANATLRIGQSTVTANTHTWGVSTSGVLRSYGDNNIDGNDDGDPAPTAIGKK